MAAVSVVPSKTQYEFIIRRRRDRTAGAARDRGSKVDIAEFISTDQKIRASKTGCTLDFKGACTRCRVVPIGDLCASVVEKIIGILTPEPYIINRV